MTSSSLPIIAPGAALPAAVRDGSPKRQDEYRAALSFERSLLLELTKQLSKTSENPENESETATTKAYRQQLPTIMADALTSAGGIGIAASIDAAQHPEEGVTS
ncbi:MAG: hypothetical protein JHC95_12160 [Solirubrobacteraceae bacterium]|nr:hypothetical protein [Solirubrobacteraceae bacterium]